MADPYLDAVIRAHEFGDRMWRELLPEARRRLLADPLLHAQVTAAVRLVEADTIPVGILDSGEVDAVRHGARLGAALALLIAERPELVTGERPTGEPPVEVIAARIAPLLSPDLAASISLIRQAAGSVLTALALQGYEVTRRADRFATIADGGRKIRIPTRGRCLTCYEQLHRAAQVDADRGDVIVGPWAHVDARAPHRDDAITAVDPR